MKRVLLFLLGWFGSVAMAQQVPDLYHYYRFPALINPAAIGMNDHTEIITIYKNQWWGIPDAPQTQLLMVNTPVKKDKLGIGFTFYNDLAHIIGHTGAYGSAAYRLSLSEEHKINFGLSLGAFNTRIFFDKIRAEDPFEASLLSNSEGRVKADANAGIQYLWKRLHVGISAQHLLQNEFQFENVKDNKSLFYKLVRHYNLSAGYKFTLSEKFSMAPVLLIRSAQGLPSQAELNNSILYKEKVWVNLAYRHKSGAGFSLGFLVEDKLTFGYHYEYPLSHVQKIGGGSHEFALSYRFGSRQDKEVIGTEKIEKLQQENEEQYEMIDQLEKKTDTLKNRVDQHDIEIEKLKEIYKKEQEESEKLKREENILPSEMKKEEIKQQEEIKKEKLIEEEKEEKEIKEKEIKKDTLKEGTGIDKAKPDLGAAHTHLDYYLVVGNFGNMQEAKLYQQVLKREYNMDTKLSLSRPMAGKSRFLVYSKVLQDSENAKKEIKRIKDLDKKHLLQQEPWLYRSK